MVCALSFFWEQFDVLFFDCEAGIFTVFSFHSDLHLSICGAVKMRTPAEFKMHTVGLKSLDGRVNDPYKHCSAEKSFLN